MSRRRRRAEQVPRAVRGDATPEAPPRRIEGFKPSQRI